MATRTKRPMSTQAQAAKLIRQELRAAFPTTAFTVTSESFAGGDAVHIDWTDGPTYRQVEDIAAKYQYGYFDGSIDYYETTNRRDDIPQVKYVQTQRDYSADATEEAIHYLNERHGWTLEPERKYSHYSQCEYVTVKPESDSPRAFAGGWKSQEVRATLTNTALVCHTCHEPAHVGDRFCGSCGTEINPDA